MKINLREVIPQMRYLDKNKLFVRKMDPVVRKMLPMMKKRKWQEIVVMPELARGK